MTTRPHKATADDLFRSVTDRLIAEIEAGAGEWVMPWQRLGMQSPPRSVRTGKHYQGINWWVLAIASADHGYHSPWWATFKQWQELLPEGAQVIKAGEKAQRVILWKSTKRKDPDGEGERDSVFATTFTVFNAEQVVDPPARYTVEPPKLSEHERIEVCEAYFAAIGANVEIGGDRAFYAPVADRIQVPPLAQFTEREHYYSTLAHEHVHWTGHESRLKRELRQRFGSEAYAAEELIAEIGAAFFSAQLGIDQATRTDHSAYLAHWLTILRGDHKAIQTAASKATAAIEYLNTAAAWQPEREMEPA